MELAYGAIRWRGRLDHHLDTLLDRGIGSLPPDVVSLLRLGAYQILFMDRVPAWAAVDESVELARAVLPPEVASWAAGLVNGVLRNLDRRRDELPLPDDPVERLAVEHSHPRWMIERWTEFYGRERTEALLAHDNEPPAVHLAVNLRRATPERALERLHGAGIEARAHPRKPEAIVLGSGNEPPALPGWEEGWFWVQDAGAQWVTEAVDPPAGRFLDAFAAPGGKLQALLSRSEIGWALGLDRSRRRLLEVRENVDRLGLSRCGLAAADARIPPTTARFGLVVADAPCTGTGVLRRRVDARWRRRPGDPGRFAGTQLEMLDALSDRVLPGGLLLYATCSLEPEENENVIDAFLEGHRAFRLDPVGERVPEGLREGPFLAVRPWHGDVDGMFAARLIRKAP